MTGPCSQAPRARSPGLDPGFTGQYSCPEPSRRMRETLAKAPVRSEPVAVPKVQKRGKRASEDQPDLIAAK
jgi:hypothetical protein